MSTNKKNSSTAARFNPPELPFKWLAVTFITPALVAILPSVFSSSEISWGIRVIVALSLLSVMLFVSVFILILRLYDFAYAQQTMSLQLESINKQTEKFESMAHVYHQRCADMDERIRKADIFLEEVTSIKNIIEAKAKTQQPNQLPKEHAEE